MTFKYGDLELTDFKVKKDKIILYCVNRNTINDVDYDIVTEEIPYSDGKHYDLWIERSYAKCEELNKKVYKYINELACCYDWVRSNSIAFEIRKCQFLARKEHDKRRRFEYLYYIEHSSKIPRRVLNKVAKAYHKGL